MKSLKTILIFSAVAFATSSWAGYCDKGPLLTPGERAEVRGIHNAFTTQARALRGEMFRSRDRLNAALSDEKTTIGEVRRLKNEHRELRREMRALRYDEKRAVERVAGANFTGRRKIKAFNRYDCSTGPMPGRNNHSENFRRGDHFCDNFGGPMMPNRDRRYGANEGYGRRRR